jgi:glutathione S-transferase
MSSNSNSLALYYSQYCYFCQKVLMFLRSKDALCVELRSTSDRQFAVELMQGGGKTQVPCLRVKDLQGSSQWMYESDDIISYLSKL